MTRFASSVLALAAMALPAVAQDGPRAFPVGIAYKAISISGFDVQKMGLTLTVAKSGDGLRGSGSAGCNTWTAGVILRDDQIDFATIATTRKLCDKNRMKAEEAFTNSLRGAQRWRIDDKNRLIIEGETARLLLAADRKSGK